MQTCFTTDSLELRPNLSLHADVTKEIVDVNTGKVKVATIRNDFKVGFNRFVCCCGCYKF